MCCTHLVQTRRLVATDSPRIMRWPRAARVSRDAGSPAAAAHWSSPAISPSGVGLRARGAAALSADSCSSFSPCVARHSPAPSPPSCRSNFGQSLPEGRIRRSVATARLLSAHLDGCRVRTDEWSSARGEVRRRGPRRSGSSQTRRPPTGHWQSSERRRLPPASTDEPPEAMSPGRLGRFR
jgi:hypothetical protein